MINTEIFEKMKFSSFGFIEPSFENTAYRLPTSHTLNTRTTAELRALISNAVHDKKDETGKTLTALVEMDCNIPMSTYKQYISGKKRHPSRAFISKLCVGLKLSIEKSNELLCAHSGVLNLTNDADAVTYYAILDKDNIYDYENELLEKCGIDSKI